METETIEAPTEITRESLIESAHQVDHDLGIEGDDQSTPKEADRATAEEPVKPETEKDGIKPESSETKPETGRERDDKGRFKPKAEEKPTPEIKPESDYDKAKKKQDREQTLLKNFQAEKEKARAEIEQKQQELQQREARLQQAAAQQRPEATKDGFTAREYYQAAQEFAKVGDHEAAYKALATAQEVRAYELRSFQQASQQQAHKSYEASWQDQMSKAFTSDPDTDPNSNSQLSQTISTLLEQYPESFYMKDGFTRIVDIARKLTDAGSVSELKEQLKQAHTELDGFKKSTQPARGGSSSPLTSKTFDNMSSDEQRDYLQRKSEEMDRESYAA